MSDIYEAHEKKTAIERASQDLTHCFKYPSTQCACEEHIEAEIDALIAGLERRDEEIAKLDKMIADATPVLRDAVYSLNGLTIQNASLRDFARVACEYIDACSADAGDLTFLRKRFEAARKTVKL